MSNPRVFCRVPADDGVLHFGLVKRLWEARHYGPLDFDVVPMVRPCEVARNTIGREFRESSAEWLVMIDNDTVPAPNFLNTLVIEAARERHPFVASPYAMIKYEGLLYLCLGKSDGKGAYNWALQGPPGWSEWDAVGFGCVALHRMVFEQLGTFEPFEPWDGVRTEDVKFCEAVAKVGIKPWTHSNLVCGHWREVDLTETMSMQGRLRRNQNAR